MRDKLKWGYKRKVGIVAIIAMCLGAGYAQLADAVGNSLTGKDVESLTGKVGNSLTGKVGKVQVQSLPVYKCAERGIEERVEDLLKRMTLEEKIGQLCCPMGWEMYEKVNGDSVRESAQFRERMGKSPVGGLWAVLRADPWTQKTHETGFNPRLSAKALNALQRYAVTQTRLGIPLLLAEECPHGHMAIGTTVFPTSLSAASTWNDSLMYRMGRAIGVEARLQGAHIGYGPVLDIARDPRWSRMEETFGEDPVLTGVMGSAVMRGMQGEKDSGRGVISTLKHFAAYGVPEGGHNGSRAATGVRQLMSEYMPPFRRAIREGAGTVMTSYNTIDGVPCSSSKYLLTDVLRNGWGFEGFVFSDLFSIDGIVGHGVAKDNMEAAAKALRAGLDMDLGGSAYGSNLSEALQQGLISVSDIDRAVRNVLRVKFEMGLFENPYVNPDEAGAQVHVQSHKDLAREVARQGTVLLKNDGVLPLSKNLRRIAVLGPNADEIYNQLGDYTAPQLRSEISTVLDGIRGAVGEGTEVVYAKGCAVRDRKGSDIPGALKALEGADVAVVVVGGSSARDFKTEYKATGAAEVIEGESEERVSDMDCGEGFDRSSLRLLGDQEELIRAVAGSGVPTVVVYIAGRAMDMNLAEEKGSALICAWYPGEQGGAAIADILFGDYNPSGRLPVSIPRSEGQLPVFYSQSNQRNYVEGPGTPLFPFGFGLSYTTFKYSDLEVRDEGKEGVLQTVSCTVENSGDRDGEEVVQLYVNDEVATVSQPSLLLKGFKKIRLGRGEKRKVSFDLTAEDLAIYDEDMNFVVEPGGFKVMVGRSAIDLPLKGEFVIAGTAGKKVIKKK